MISQNVAQSPMEQVGYRMVGADPCPVVAINFKTCNIAGFYGSFNHFAAVNNHAVDFLFGVSHFNGETVAFDQSDIADLTAGFTVKGGLVGNQIKFAVVNLFNLLSVLDQCRYLSVSFKGAVTEKFGFAEPVEQFKPDFFNSFVTGAGPVFARFVALLFHCLIKTVGIDGNVFGLESVLSEVKRKTVCIVKLERGFAGQGIAFFQTGGFVVQQTQAFFEGADEFAFFGFQGFGDQSLGTIKLGVGFAHFLL